MYDISSGNPTPSDSDYRGPVLIWEQVRVMESEVQSPGRWVVVTEVCAREVEFWWWTMQICHTDWLPLVREEKTPRRGARARQDHCHHLHWCGVCPLLSAEINGHLIAENESNWTLSFPTYCSFNLGRMELFFRLNLLIMRMIRDW